MKNKLKLLIVLLSFFGIRNIQAVSLPDSTVVEGGKYIFATESTTEHIYINILNDHEMALFSEYEQGTYENTQGTYTISGNKLTYSRLEAFIGEGTYENCLSSDRTCHYQDKTLPLQEEFMISSDGKSLTSSTYGKNLKLENGNVVITYQDPDHREYDAFKEAFISLIKNAGADNIEFDEVETDTEKIFIMRVTDGDKTYSKNLIYKNGILSFAHDKENESIENGLLDYLLFELVIEAVADIKDYDMENFHNFLRSLTYEQLNNTTLENDGFDIRYGEWSSLDENASMGIQYLATFNIDLINGIKAYDPNIKYEGNNNDNIFDEIEKNKDTILSGNISNKTEGDKKVVNNPPTGSFISVTLIVIMAIIGTVIFYYSKKKNKIYKI